MHLLLGRPHRITGLRAWRANEVSSDRGAGVKSEGAELPNIHALISVLISCMSKMNVIRNGIKKGFNVC